MNIEKIEELIIKSCKELYKNDRYLINFNLNERTIVFRFGLYMHLFMLKDVELRKYDLDNEYNKNIDKNKITMNSPNGRYVDLIIHKRGSNCNNLLAIEFKRKNNSEKDKKKIDDLMSPKCDFRYKYGATITFKVDKVIYHIKSGEDDWQKKELIFVPGVRCAWKRSISVHTWNCQLNVQLFRLKKNL